MKDGSLLIADDYAGRDLPRQLLPLIVDTEELRVLAGAALVAARPGDDDGSAGGGRRSEAGLRKSTVKACHGADGNADVPGTPSLAGQPVYFTHWQLIKFRDGRRKDPQMSSFARTSAHRHARTWPLFYAGAAAAGPAGRHRAGKSRSRRSSPRCTHCVPATARLNRPRAGAAPGRAGPRLSVKPARFKARRR